MALEDRMIKVVREPSEAVAAVVAKDTLAVRVEQGVAKERRRMLVKEEITVLVLVVARALQYVNQVELILR